jgi:flagellar biosynthetic protein FliR
VNVPPFDARLLPIAALLCFRVLGLMLIAPTLSARAIPMQWRTALGILLTILLLPAAASTNADVQVTPAAIVVELMIGFTIGFGAALLIGAVESAGDVIAQQSGLSAASTLDPLAGLSVPVVGELFKLTVIVLLLIGGGHLFMLRAIADSVTLLPVGEPVAFTDALAELIRQGAVLLSLGVRFAAPVVLVVFLTNTALGALARTAPSLNVFMLAYPLQIGLALITLGITLPFTMQLAGGWEGAHANLLERAFDALRGAP